MFFPIVQSTMEIPSEQAICLLIPPLFDLATLISNRVATCPVVYEIILYWKIKCCVPFAMGRDLSYMIVSGLKYNILCDNSLLFPCSVCVWHGILHLRPGTTGRPAGDTVLREGGRRPCGMGYGHSVLFLHVQPPIHKYYQLPILPELVSFNTFLRMYWKSDGVPAIRSTVVSLIPFHRDP